MLIIPVVIGMIVAIDICRERIIAGLFIHHAGTLDACKKSMQFIESRDASRTDPSAPHTSFRLAAGSPRVRFRGGRARPNLHQSW